MIGEDQARFFRDNGFVVLRQLVDAEELAGLRDATQRLLDRSATAAPSGDPYPA